MHGSLHNQKGAFQRVKLKRPWSADDLELYEETLCAEAREDFYAYRKLMMPDLIIGWYQQKVAEALTEFYYDWLDGLAPVLVLEAPPQHGKSRQVIDFISWASGHHPDTKSIYASYSDELGDVANSILQRHYASEKWQKIFDENFLNFETRGRRGVGGGAKANSNVIEYLGHEGSFRNTTVNGQITGMGLHLGVIDDPMKGRAEASSLKIRDKTWSWFTDDFFSRFAETAGMIMMMTRWHLDDPVGRFLEKYPNANRLTFPALGKFTKSGKWRASEAPDAQALFPEFKSKKFLLKRKKLYTASSWSSLYQQNPVTIGGGQFPVQKFRMVQAVPVREIMRSVRYWDKAGTAENRNAGAYTCGVLMHLLVDGTTLIEDVIRGHWSALDREARIKQACELDNDTRLTETWVEQEPGSGGKESAESTIRNLRGYKVYADRVTGKKEDRCEPYAAQQQNGNVALLRAPWNKVFIDEHETWPNGTTKDQVDAAGGAFMKLTVRKSSYDSTMAWVTEDNR